LNLFIIYFDHSVFWIRQPAPSNSYSASDNNVLDFLNFVAVGGGYCCPVY
jgi:hypothetical protein